MAFTGLFARNTLNRLIHSMTSVGAANDLIDGFSKLLYVNTAPSTAITNAAAEAAFSTTYSIPKNTLQVGSVIKIRFQGIATATTSTDTLQIKLYIGGLTGTALLTSAATDATNSDIFAGDFFLVIRTIGSSGTFVGNGNFTKVEAASGTATRVESITASTAIDTTVDQAITVSATWSAQSASDSCRLDILAVEAY